MTTAATAAAIPRAYFDRAFAAFQSAARRAGVRTRECVVAGTTVRLHFAGDAMVPAFFPALEHLANPAIGAGPRLDLHVWDSASTGEPMPAPEWPLEAYAGRGEIRPFHDSEIRAAFTVDGPMMELWDRTTGDGLVWAGDHARVPYYQRGSPALRIFSWWLARHGRQLIHAGAVGTAESCLLLAGKGGSGKSNAALLCLGAGLIYLADDYCVLEPGAVPTAHSLYGTGKVHAGDLSRLGFLAGKAGNTAGLPQEKALFFAADHFRAQLGARAPIVALVMPRVRLDAPTCLVPASAAEAARTVAMSTIAQVPYAGAEVLRSVAVLTRQVPSFHLNIGADAATRVPAIVRELAAGHRGAAGA